jgi:polysaccharide biosynthesis protein PslG
VGLLRSWKYVLYIALQSHTRLTVVFFLFFLSVVDAIGAPDAVAGEFIIGVGTHLTGGNRPIEIALDMMAAAGIVNVRDDVPWAAVEQRKGELHIPPHWDILVNEARKRHISPLLILDYGNKFYDSGGKPHSIEGIAAFTRYAKFVVRHFKGRVFRYEIWNEWEQYVGHTRPGSAEDYVRLIRNVYPAVKKVDPQVEVLVGAVAADGVRSGYLQQIVKLGVLNYADSLSLHAYVYREPGASDPDFWAGWIRSVESSLADIQGKQVPFYITEIGWPTNVGKYGVSEETEADYLRRTFTLARQLPFIKGIWWYDFQDDGSDSANPEYNFGLVRQDFSEKPAYDALRDLNRQQVKEIK